MSANFIANPDFSVNTTGQTSWTSLTWFAVNAIDGWSVIRGTLTDTGNGVRLEPAYTGQPTPRDNNGYLVQLIPKDAMSLFVGKKCTLTATVNGQTYSASGIIQTGAEVNSISYLTQWGAISLYRYPDDGIWHGAYAPTVTVNGENAPYIDVTGMSFGLALSEIADFDKTMFLAGVAVGMKLRPDE